MDLLCTTGDSWSGSEARVPAGEPALLSETQFPHLRCHNPTVLTEGSADACLDPQQTPGENMGLEHAQVLYILPFQSPLTSQLTDSSRGELQWSPRGWQNTIKEPQVPNVLHGNQHPIQ